MITGYEGGTPNEESEAKAILSLLWGTYPGYPWHVTMQGGVIFIKHMTDALTKPWGMSVLYNAVNYDAAVMKKEILRNAGEWLERCGLRRGKANDDEIVSVEGVPLRHHAPGADRE